MNKENFSSLILHPASLLNEGELNQRHYRISGCSFEPWS
jgi:hypothetical protein